MSDNQPIIDVVNTTAEDRLFSSLHMVTYYLNPHHYYIYKNNIVKKTKVAKDGFINVELFTQTHLTSYELLINIDTQVSPVINP